MSPSFQDLLSLEIKKEIADRYFGFRKLIEEDMHDLESRIRRQSFILQKRISFELLRIFLLLRNDHLILAFLDLAGLRRDIFYDPQLAKLSDMQQRIFAGVPLAGFTRFGKFFKLLLRSYDHLTIHTAHYRNKVQEIFDLKENIDEEIKYFYRQNDLGSILAFLKAMGDQTNAGPLEGGLEQGLSDGLEQKMQINPPLPIEHFLPIISDLPPLAQVRKKLKKLAKEAYDVHGIAFLNAYPTTEIDPNRP